MTCQEVEYQIKCSLSAIFLPKITALQETQDTKEENVKVSINFIPFNSKSDQHLISLYSNTTETLIGHFTVVCLVAKPLIWSEAEGDLVVIETSI